MPLAADTQFGPYRIVAPIGAGGMGEVYRARDTRLERDVALKVMPATAAVEPSRRTRFEREARAVAALNHPNIVAIHDFGEQDGALYIVTELINGESLRKRIERGVTGARELLNIAAQMADGMAAAHQVGIVHRDLKPENIMITSEGRVKILDFGLARRELAGAVPEHTVSLDNTVPGTMIGTVTYMSPEQARGTDAGYRSDQFSFGLILHEMASGEQTFKRETTPQTLTAILVEEPKPLDAKIPAPLRWTISRCLAKDAGARYESTRDLCQDLRSQLEHLSELSGVAPVAGTARAKRKWFGTALMAGVFGAVCAVAGFYLAPKHQPIEHYRYTPIEISRDSPGKAAWSPDGKAFTYSALYDGQRQVFVRYLNSPLATRLTNKPEGAYPLGWSPDGKLIFVAAKNPAGERPEQALFSLSVTGGEPELLMPLDVVSSGGMAVARVSPDGKALLAHRREADGMLSLAISSPVGSAWKRYAPAPFESKLTRTRPSFDLSPDGKKIVYFLNNGSETQTWLLPYPAGTGTPKRILPDLQPLDTPTISWFPDGRHVAASYAADAVGEEYHLWALDTAGGKRRLITGGLLNDRFPAVSPNGKQILLFEEANEYRMVSASLKDGAVRTVMRSQKAAGMPSWAAKSERFVYETGSHGEPEVWLRESDGAERPVLTQAALPPGAGGRFMNPALSPDGSRLAVAQIPQKGDSKIWIASVAGGTPVRLTNEQVSEVMAAWSPDGGRIVYLRAKDGVYSMMAAKASGQAKPVELARDASPQTLPDWSPTGEWIVYATADGSWRLISPDGKEIRGLGKIATQHLAFSKDGKTLYGIRAEGEHGYLFSMGIGTGQIKTIGDVGGEFAPRSYISPGIRFSVAPDGGSVLYPAFGTKTGLWMLEGFDRP